LDDFLWVNHLDTLGFWGGLEAIGGVFQSEDNCDNICLGFIWTFPKIGVPLNHPFVIGFAMK
jgi:hypothetical protein